MLLSRPYNWGKNEAIQKNCGSFWKNSKDGIEEIVLIQKEICHLFKHKSHPSQPAVQKLVFCRPCTDVSACVSVGTAAALFHDLDVCLKRLFSNNNEEPILLACKDNNFSLSKLIMKLQRAMLSNPCVWRKGDSSAWVTLFQTWANNAVRLYLKQKMKTKATQSLAQTCGKKRDNWEGATERARNCMGPCWVLPCSLIHWWRKGDISIWATLFQTLANEAVILCFHQKINTKVTQPLLQKLRF